MSEHDSIGESWISDIEGRMIYNSIRKAKKTFTEKLPQLDHYPTVTPDDIDNGILMRYFVRQANHYSGDILEIDERRFNKLRINPMYKTVKVAWKITGRLDDVMGTNNINSPTRLVTGVNTANKMAIEDADKELPGLKYKIMNYSQFWKDNGEA